jgi:hypothetical protein
VSFRPVALLAALWVAAAGCSDDDANFASATGVGNHCRTDGDCRTGECYLGPGGGYCTTLCDVEGDTAPCPLDTVCKPIQGGPRRCLLICGSDTSCGELQDCGAAHCPEGSSCVEVGDTHHQACEPIP